MSSPKNPLSCSSFLDDSLSAFTQNFLSGRAAALGKAGLVLCDLAELAVQALNDIRRVYDFPNLGGICEKGTQNIPVLLPAFDAGGVLLPFFNYVLTTNYDLLVEKITDGAVSHLHGCYTRQPQIVLGQSLGVFIDAVRYDLSSILIGDYFVAKSFYATTVHMAQKDYIGKRFSYQ